MTSADYTGSPQPKLRALIEIMRFDKPIGTFLLMAPTLWGLVLANRGLPPIDLLAIFFLGAVVMRAAGCTANDLADRELDGFVERTRQRPLVTGALSGTEALVLMVVLLALALGLVMLTNPLTITLSLAGVVLAIIYPFMKRITHLPQLVLGTAFSWSIPMAFAASLDALPVELWWLFAANLLWTVVYDTQYAMVDREDDLSIGIKSTAILFGGLDVRIIALLQLACILCFIGCGVAFDLGFPWYLAVAAVGALFCWHLRLIRDRDRAACFKAFNQARWIGAIILAGLLGQFLLPGV
ncbi:4-hydroxybenzoate polyprenyl transferase [Luminiphilus syltensis NOR5-1B]|uniref:4-hydroxybenzoate octaprenyltransferase n=1 Tax=Luminiphilus syltensis NOR5-1B TaxID=565045 RepID=B8KUB0_9GAMM|nr:4-hydroxybenzoate octaprenyltransferase [Luminiphilus syltensis]EED35863.1 4-hydroxybenzoate polyprenyl transferase [Luminiphilus syltensis NOR5-1B]